MSNPDRSLDDIIKMNKKSGGGGGAKPRGGGARNSGPGPGPARRLHNRGANRTAPYAPFRGSRGGCVRAPWRGTSLPISGKTSSSWCKMIILKYPREKKRCYGRK
ncbi:hypothetical protein RHMOL_Rhmol05G0248500 [Rhododendron molle]|uniref:Uncharacterized protein n=1 Tax=Rhododendron molle TaxID=49168 RepID=A0ACC0NTS7_RHOML|nr:hypothetical protein RHMOL_Rhmol05G0248500 [Rhododendron molle]